MCSYVVTPIQTVFCTYACVCVLKETLEHDNRVRCTTCNRKENATSQLHLHQPPQILVIHLKRFQTESFPFTKIDTNVSIPLRMQLPSFLTPALDDVLPFYNLYAVSNHHGTIASGHYTATCNIRRDLHSSGWHVFSDQTSQPCSSTMVSTQSAYLLFYRRTKWNTLTTPRIVYNSKLNDPNIIPYVSVQVYVSFILNYAINQR